LVTCWKFPVVLKALFTFASAAVAESKIHALYEKAAAKRGKRPFDLAVSDYFKGKDLLAKK